MERNGVRQVLDPSLRTRWSVRSTQNPHRLVDVAFLIDVYSGRIVGWKASRSLPLAIRYSERLAENRVVASVGSKRDSYENALVESLVVGQFD